ALFDLQPDKRRQRRALGVLEVIEQGSRRRNRRRQIGGTETGKVTGLELATQGLSGAVDVELPGCEPFATAADVIERGMGEVVRHQQFRRRDSLQLLRQQTRRDLVEDKVAGGQIDARKSQQTITRRYRQQQTVARLVQQGAVGQR